MDFVGARLTRIDLEILREGVAALRRSTPHRADELDGLSERLNDSVGPAITIGVFGGLVQWVRGNPFPIRIIDYDGEADELPDRDDEGHPCSLWHVERDPDAVQA